MILPPVTTLAPWRPGHWITQTGYGLNRRDVIAGTKGDLVKGVDMLAATRVVDRILEKVMGK